MRNLLIKLSIPGLAVYSRVYSPDNNSLNCGREYDGENSRSGCFQTTLEGLCRIANPSCIKLECTHSGMRGFVRGDALGFKINDLPDATDLLVNENNSCVGLRKAGYGYTIDLKYGDCDMIVLQRDGKIVFKSVVSVNPESDHRKTSAELTNNILNVMQDGVVFGGEYFRRRPILFSCEFTDRGTTSRTLSLTSATLGALGISQTDLEFGLELDFYDANFENKLDYDVEQMLSGPMNVQISMANPLGAVQFYVDSCEVSDAQFSLAVITDSCPIGDFLAVDDHGSRLGDTKLQYSWKAFTFDQSAGTHVLTVTCHINFCIPGQCELKSCEEEFANPYAVNIG